MQNMEAFIGPLLYIRIQPAAGLKVEVQVYVCVCLLGRAALHNFCSRPYNNLYKRPLCYMDV